MFALFKRCVQMDRNAYAEKSSRPTLSRTECTLFEVLQAVTDLNNRWFGARPVYAELSPVTDFREACCREGQTTLLWFLLSVSLIRGRPQVPFSHVPVNPCFFHGFFSLPLYLNAWPSWSRQSCVGWSPSLWFVLMIGFPIYTFTFTHFIHSRTRHVS
jgi:hypothetical protein